MDCIYLIAYGFLLWVCAWQDNNTRHVSPYAIIGMWIITALSGVNLVFTILTFATVWFAAEVFAHYKKTIWTFGDVLGLPTFAGFMLYFNQTLGALDFAFPIIIFVFLNYIIKDKNNTVALYVPLFTTYFFWFILALCSKNVSFS
jgi:hypothetical protein